MFEGTRKGLKGAFVLTICIAMTCVAWAGSTNANTSSNGYAIANNTPGFVKKAVDKGPVDPSMVISIDVWLDLNNQQGLDNLYAQQQTKGSANYHKWISQQQFNQQFAPTAQQVNATENYLKAKGLSVLHVPEDNLYVKVQGTVGAIEKAFNVQIDSYSLNGVTYRSNTGNPTISGLTGAHVAGITGMDDYGFQPNSKIATDPDGKAAQIPLSQVTPGGVFFESQCFRGVETQTFNGDGHTATYTGNRYGADISNNTLGHLAPCGYAPNEVRTAYNVNNLLQSGFDGTGQTVVITDAFGSSTIAQDADIFSQIYGLPRITSENFQLVRAPGVYHNPGDPGWDSETTLDVEWVHAMAPGAKIVLVAATNRASLDEAVNYAVVHHFGNTISNSWSIIEGFENPAQYNRDNRILEMAAVQGVDVNFATGDFGDETIRVGFKSVDFPASSPFATAIGGTSLALNPDNTIDFQTGWGTNETRIANTSAEGNSPTVPPIHFGTVLGAGGGASMTFAKPAFQSSLPGTMRMLPDVSMLADPFTGVEIIQTIGGETFVEVIGGTSLATPMFSGVMAIAAQKAGHALGQAAPLVYQLDSSAITDVSTPNGSNNVSGTVDSTFYSADQLASPLDGVTSYYSAMYNSPFTTRWFVLTFGTDTSLITGPGWDPVTGVGTPNGQNFVDEISALP